MFSRVPKAFRKRQQLIKKWQWSKRIRRICNHLPIENAISKLTSSIQIKLSAETIHHNCLPYLCAKTFRVVFSIVDTYLPRSYQCVQIRRNIATLAKIYVFCIEVICLFVISLVALRPSHSIKLGRMVFLLPANQIKQVCIHNRTQSDSESAESNWPTNQRTQLWKLKCWIKSKIIISLDYFNQS